MLCPSHPYSVKTANQRPVRQSPTYQPNQQLLLTAFLSAEFTVLQPNFQLRLTALLSAKFNVHHPEIKIFGKYVQIHLLYTNVICHSAVFAILLFAILQFRRSVIFLVIFAIFASPFNYLLFSFFLFSFLAVYCFNTLYFSLPDYIVPHPLVEQVFVNMGVHFATRYFPHRKCNDLLITSTCYFSPHKMYGNN